ncbi:hypothetical protein Tco_0751791 [Tanacetum coccineum]|uniref:Uncharacterized protein n=1 Tax=Tanacetum coccineum TaxID=301880 RepID=A0ABQ4Z614_9ASTR
MEIEPDIENMTLNEYWEYEAEKERQLWDNVRSRRSPTNYDEDDFDSFHWNKRADNLKRIGQDIVQDSICEHDVDLEEDQEKDRDIFYMWDITVEDVERIRNFLTPNVPNVMDNIIQPLISKIIHTTSPDEDYVAPATKSILDDLLEEFREEILNVTMVDEGAECKDLEELERLLTKDPQSHYTKIQVDRDIISPGRFSLQGDGIRGIQVDAREWCLVDTWLTKKEEAACLLDSGIGRTPSEFTTGSN